MPHSDENLVKEVQNGNEHAMEILVKRNYNIVHSFLYRNTSDSELSYDLTQEVFIKVIKNINQFNDEKGKFKSWLLKIAVNVKNDYFKSSSYKHFQNIDDIDNHDIEDKNNLIDILSQKDETKKVKEAISELSPLQREAIILKYYDDLKIKEISKITGSNENTIKSRLLNGVKSLKKILGGEKVEKTQNTNFRNKV
ncbi:RNA polymerase sigma factor [Terrisporobacter glycolicus]|uniref:ECF RNA polymerase sigma factor SigK n=1 Tax=Terrisporobacter glycolicus ATCC 14880 = DSM 1288 TaxID=1121315 RepID=A0ABZ2EVU6_9FIRM|nr:RNA polymerase sigma factor [Terrisporobacter glycolicus]